ncbi:unnamed protein product [Closterium sp. Yama58-4]|nr:unnamed protein product [Closterium sp. Yama58-4]
MCCSDAMSSRIVRITMGPGDIMTVRLQVRFCTYGSAVIRCTIRKSHHLNQPWPTRRCDPARSSSLACSAVAGRRELIASGATAVRRYVASATSLASGNRALTGSCSLRADLTSTYQSFTYTLSIAGITIGKTATVTDAGFYKVSTGALVKSIPCTAKANTATGTWTCTADGGAQISSVYAPVDPISVLVSAGVYASPSSFYFSVKVDGVKVKGNVAASIAQGSRFLDVTSPPRRPFFFSRILNVAFPHRRKETLVAFLPRRGSLASRFLPVALPPRRSSSCSHFLSWSHLLSIRISKPVLSPSRRIPRRASSLVPSPSRSRLHASSPTGNGMALPLSSNLRPFFPVLPPFITSSPSPIFRSASDSFLPFFTFLLAPLFPSDAPSASRHDAHSPPSPTLTPPPSPTLTPLPSHTLTHLRRPRSRPSLSHLHSPRFPTSTHLLSTPSPPHLRSASPHLRLTSSPLTSSPPHLISASPHLRLSSSPPHHISASPHLRLSPSPPHLISASSHLRLTSSPPHLISPSPHLPLTSSPPHPISASPHLRLSSSPPHLISASPHLRLTSSPPHHISASPHLRLSPSPPHLISASPHLRLTSSPPHLIFPSPHLPLTSSPPHPISASPHLRLTLSPPHLISASPNLRLTSSPPHLISASPQLRLTTSTPPLISASPHLRLTSSPHHLISPSPHPPLIPSPPLLISASPHLRLTSSLLP